jgi:hypothetical protein
MVSGNLPTAAPLPLSCRAAADAVWSAAVWGSSVVAKKKIRISDRRRRKEKKKSQELDKKGPFDDGSRTDVGVSKRLDLHSKEQESTSHHKLRL